MAVAPRGPVTFAFCDVEGSTRLWQEHPDHMGAVLARHDRWVLTAADDHAGYVFATGGDSFGVAFENAADAVTWARTVHVGLAEQQWPAGIELKVRVGMHTGEAEERGGGYFGQAVNLAARIGAVGHGGQTLVSEATASIIPDVCTELGQFRLKDFDGSRTIFQVGTEAFPHLRTDEARRGNLPRRLGQLIGREDALARLDDAVTSTDAPPLLTLVGAGGIGKTRLAIELARRTRGARRDGAWLIDLAPTTNVADVPRVTADALRVPHAEGRSITESIVEELATRRVILVVDNCEHVIEGARSLVTEVLEQCPFATIVATSREPLGVAGERVFDVEPLAVRSAAVELFAQRASAVDHGFVLEQHRASVVDICARLDGLPLAIELAAARVRSLSPAELATRLDDHFTILTTRHRGIVERHRTLRATVDWSYTMLAAGECAIFDRLSVFVGGFDLAAVNAVCEDLGMSDLEIAGTMDRLIERSMVSAESGPFGRRFRLLETLRQYGRERLAASGLAEGVERAHARWYRAHAVQLGRLLAGADEIEGVARAGEAWDNLRAAMRWACDNADVDTGHTIATAVSGEMVWRGRTEVGDWVERLAGATPVEHPALPEMIAFAAHRYRHANDPEGFHRFTERWNMTDRLRWRMREAFRAEDYERVVRLVAIACGQYRQGRRDYPNQSMPLLRAQALIRLTRLRVGINALRAVEDEAHRHGPPTLERFALEQQVLHALGTGEVDAVPSVIERAAQIEVPPGTISLAPLFDTFALLNEGDTVGAVRHLRDKLRSDIDRESFAAFDADVALFMNIADRLDLLTPLARVHRWSLSGSAHRRYEGFSGDALVRLATRPLEADRDVTGDVGLTSGELAAYIVEVLDTALDRET